MAMAKSISEEELQLRKRARRRLVGAIALVTIIAVFLPMVLDHEPKPVSEDISIRIPSPNSGAFTSKIVPVAPVAKSAPEPEVTPATPTQAPAPIAPAKSAAPKAAAAMPAAKPAVALPSANDTEAAPPLKSESTKASSPAPKPAVAVKPQSAEKTKSVAKGGATYVVQVAALNDPDKAKQMRDQIAAAGVKAYTEAVPTAKGKVTRVRAGPFASRADADKARETLKGMGLNGNVIPK
jgi:DedD protein